MAHDLPSHALPIDSMERSIPHVAHAPDGDLAMDVEEHAAPHACHGQREALAPCSRDVNHARVRGAAAASHGVCAGAASEPLSARSLVCSAGAISSCCCARPSNAKPAAECACRRRAAFYWLSLLVCGTLRSAERMKLA